MGKHLPDGKSLLAVDLSRLDDYESQVYEDMINKGRTKEDALKIIINTVEGDSSQLSKELAGTDYAKQMSDNSGSVVIKDNSRVGKEYFFDGHWHKCVEDNGDRGFFEPLNTNLAIVPRLLIKFSDIKDAPVRINSTEIKKKGKHLGDSKNKGRHLGYSEMAKKVIKIGDKVLVNVGKYKNEEGKVIDMGIKGNNYKVEFSDGSKAIIFPTDLKLKENKLVFELSQGLLQFTGTENYYKHWVGNYVYTDGVKFLADKAGAYWLIDAIFSYRRKEPFQVWELAVDTPRNKALLTMREDTKYPPKVRQEIPFTDFPLDYIKLYLIDNVLLLPSEY